MKVRPVYAVAAFVIVSIQVLFIIRLLGPTSKTIVLPSSFQVDSIDLKLQAGADHKPKVKSYPLLGDQKSLADNEKAQLRKSPAVIDALVNIVPNDDGREAPTFQKQHIPQPAINKPGLRKPGKATAELSSTSSNRDSLVAPLPEKKAALNHKHSKRQHSAEQLQHVRQAYEQKPVMVENNPKFTPRPLTPHEEAGDNILFTLRTTGKFHETRLPVLFDTWLSKANRSNVFLVTDKEDEKWKGKDGLGYVNVPCRASYLRDDLCCKAGTELSLMFREDTLHFDWFCHVDDDIYVLIKPLVEQLSKFHPREQPVYYGRGGEWGKTRKVIEGSKYGKPGDRYHFAVGGMYCLSRAMVELAKPYLVGGKAFADSCKKTLEPEDVTVGVIVGVVLHQNLSQTEMIYTHGLSLESESMVIQSKLDKQICFAYGFGAAWHITGSTNHIIVPHALYTYKEDMTQFYSLHCHLYPQLPRCMQKAKEMAEQLKQAKPNKNQNLNVAQIPNPAVH